MGTSTSFGQAAVKLRQAAAVIDGQAKTRALHAIGKDGKGIILRTFERDMGGNLTLSHWRGSRVSAGYDLESDRVVFKPRDTKGGALLRVLEDGAGAHVIRRRKKRGRVSLKIGGQFVGRSVLHSGTRGKRTVTDARQRMRREDWAQRFHREYARELARIF